MTVTLDTYIVATAVENDDDDYIPPDVYMQPNPYELEDEAFA